MEGIIGVTFKDFALLAADTTSSFSIITIKNDENKLYQLNENLMMAVCGEPGDTKQFAEFIEKNIQLYKMRNGFNLSPSAAANFIQRNLADYLRSRSPYQCNLLLVGYDETNGPELYYIDYLGTMAKLPFGLHGYPGAFGTSVFDRFHRNDMTVDEAYELLKKVVYEIQKRLIVNLPAFKVAIVRKNEIKYLDDIKIDATAIGLNAKPLSFK